MPGRPALTPRVPMNIIDRVASAPTERSMPAVRMMRVWPMASMATIAVCCTSSDREFAEANRGLMIEKTTTVTTRRAAGLTVGWACRRCCTRWTGPWARRESSA